ncbi:mitochondrial import inner membrane translocase subunit Tim21 isoform X2 [Emydura macquarii macquarii]|uniref:mitochondrial import inner membrane translocase subunit Tim21 isoform X2 n=1 Tax=Emydura macquarii macquarii TaxID=1129001 RepID=UPI00352B4AD1
MFSASFMRVIQCTEKLQVSPGKWLLVPRGKARLRPWRCFRWGQEVAHRGSVLRPHMFLQGAKQNIWTQEGSVRAENNSKEVSVQRNKKGGAPLSAAEKGGLFYVIFKELFSSSSPSKIYGNALEKCRSHPEVISVFGEPIKGYGEPTRRGRRQHVSHIEYVKDELKYMRLKFYIEGSERGKQGTVHVEMKENPESGRYEYRFIFVDIDAYPRRTIVIEDNR